MILEEPEECLDTAQKGCFFMGALSGLNSAPENCNGIDWSIFSSTCQLMVVHFSVPESKHLKIESRGTEASNLGMC